MQKLNLDCHFSAYTKIIVKYIMNLNIAAKHQNSKKKKTRENLCGIGLGKDLLHKTQKA